VQPPSALGGLAVEGAFASAAYTSFSTLTAGPAGAIVAGLHGVAIGRFAWAQPDGIALNTRTTAEDLLGFVLPELGPGVDWRRVFFDDASKTWRIRQGMNISLLKNGTVWGRFRYGARPGSPVYANLLDGSLISGYSDAGELTPWVVSSAAGPGGLAIITTWSRPI
jgi:hypothetical protein